MPLNITVDGLALKQTGVPLVGDWNAYENQLYSRYAFNKTHQYKHLKDEDSYYILNYAPTGGGKTMSWVDPAVRYNIDTLVMYPTNALSEDQIESIENYIDELYDKSDSVGTLEITGPRLDEMRRDDRRKAGNNGELFAAEIKRMKRKYDSIIVFTNPDIFTNLRNDVYRSSYAKRMSEIFELVVVDEFHWADINGQCSIVNLLEQVRSDENSKTEKCMLLSATPDDEVMEMLNSSNAPVIDVSKNIDKRPQSEVAEEVTKSDSDPSKDYRAVMPPVDLELRRGQAFQTGDQLLSDKWRDNLVNFCRQAQKTVLMLDSQKEVGKVTAFLNQTLPVEHEVIQIDGQNNTSLREDISRFNNEDKPMVMVSNSAVEVGIDFKTDQILFSATNDSRMLQRFGRLRNRSDKRKAIAYIPGHVYERFKRQLAEKQEDTGEDNPTFTRSEIREAMNETYFESRRPHSFPVTYGAHAAYEQAQRHMNQSVPERKHKIQERAKERIHKLFIEPYDTDIPWDEFERDHRQMDEKVIQALMQYRSGNPATLIYDTRKNAIRRQDVQSVLRTGNIDIVESQKFYSRIPDDLRKDAKRIESHTYGHIIYHGNEYTEISGTGQNYQDRKIYLRNTGHLQTLKSQDPVDRTPEALSEFQLYVDPRDLSPIDDIEPLNNELSEAEPLVYPIEMDSYQARYEYNLDDFFFLTDIADGQSTAASAAIGQNALYLYLIRQERLYRENPERTDLNIPIPNTIWDSGKY